MIVARQARAQRQSLKGPPQQSLTVISKKHTEKAAPNDLGLMLGGFLIPRLNSGLERKKLDMRGGRLGWKYMLTERLSRRHTNHAARK